MKEPFCLDDYVSAGYFIGLPLAEAAGPLPANRITAAGPRFPNLSEHLGASPGLSANDRAFGLAANRLSELRQWLRRHEGVWIGWDDVFYSAETALDVARRFLPGGGGHVIFGLACPRASVETLQAMIERPREGSQAGMAAMLQSEAQLDPDGAFLGIDLVTVQTRRPRSLLEPEHAKELSRVLADRAVRLNGNGLVMRMVDAEKLARNQHRGQWLPMPLIRYD